MNPPPKWVMICTSVLPVIGQCIFIYVLSFTYSNVLFVRPESNRSMIRDILLGVLTCGLYLLAIPSLLIRETQEGAKRLNVKIPNYTPIAIFLAIINITLGLAILGFDEFILYGYIMFMQCIYIYLFLTPFEIIHQEYKEFMD